MIEIVLLVCSAIAAMVPTTAASGNRYCLVNNTEGATQNCSINDCIDEGSLIWHLMNWSFSWSVVLIVFIAILQYGRPQFSWFMYGVKMLIMWLLWPLVLALTIFNAYAEFKSSRYVMFGFSVSGAMVTLVMWIMYFARSIQLWRRTRTWWSFNPETNAILCLSSVGKRFVLPLSGAPTGVTLTLLSGNLYAEGFKVGSGVNVDNLPKYIMVATPGNTIVYHQVGKSLKASSATGWSYYVRAKAGDYSTEARHDNLSEHEKLLHMV
ncbi:membrane protein [Ferret coronavirus]|uniref:Membrane protein n=1 Tax=Ferret coronavirus TaxID=1264898 RepID=A0A172B6J4_9ALPC|nr:membrane protein [Ferret coronavirus]AKG92643.1 membrane protein [Ferret coronavirus]